MSRGALAGSFLMQALCIVVAAVLVRTNVVPNVSYLQEANDQPVDFKELIPLAFLAFQSGGQMIVGRTLGVSEIPTTVLTSVYCDLANDPRLSRWENAKRNRRIGAILGILLGGICGGWLSRTGEGLAAALWCAAGVKFCLVGVWMGWMGKEDDGA